MNTKIPKLAVIAVMAAGKTSATRLLAAMNPNVLLVPEPVEKWQQSGHLKRFYEDKRKYAFDWQTHVVKTRYEDLQETLQKSGNLMEKVVVLDGHMQTDRHGFVQTLFEDGDMIESDKMKYEQEFDKLMPRGVEEDEFFVFLRCKPEVCLARARMRARSEEVAIPLSYLQHLDRNFEAFTLRPEVQGKIVIIDVSNKTLVEVVMTLNYITEKLKEQGNLEFDIPSFSKACARCKQVERKCSHVMPPFNNVNC